MAVRFKVIYVACYVVLHYLFVGQCYFTDFMFTDVSGLSLHSLLRYALMFRDTLLTVSIAGGY